MDIQTKGRVMHQMIGHLLVLLLLAVGGVAHAGTVTYVYTDPQGTPLAEADAAGHITATFDYAPYGGQALGTAPSGPGYTGHVNDPDTGLVYMQARYYDPQVGRFISTDPIGPAAGNPFNFNRFAYANNSPAVNIDPDGKCTGSLFCDGSGARISGVVGAGYTMLVNSSSSEGGSQSGKPGATGGSAQSTAGGRSNEHKVYAVDPGVVRVVGWQKPGDHKAGAGYRIQIQEVKDKTRIYGHLDPNSIVVKVNESVSDRQYLGKYADPTNGHSNGPHVHDQLMDFGSGFRRDVDPGRESPLGGDGGRITTPFGVRDSMHPNAHQGTDWADDEKG